MDTIAKVVVCLCSGAEGGLALVDGDIDVMAMVDSIYWTRSGKVR